MILFPFPFKPIDLLASLPLRRSSVFAAPGSQSLLPIMLGDWRDMGVVSTLVDSVNNVYSPSDLPMGTITKVSVLGDTGAVEEVFEEGAHAFSFHPSYVDATGRSIAAVQSSTSLGIDKRVRVFGTGVSTPEGDLVENPVDLLLWAVSFLGFSSTALDHARLEASRYTYSKAQTRLRYFLREEQGLKIFLDQVCFDSSSSLVSEKGLTWLEPILAEALNGV